MTATPKLEGPGRFRVKPAGRKGKSRTLWNFVRVREILSFLLALKSNFPENSSRLSFAVPFGTRNPDDDVGIRPALMYFCATGSNLDGSITPCAAKVGLDWK